MGIPKLNSYLLNNCSKHSIDQKHLSVCTGKTIVIDTSIYLYKFASMGSIIEPLYHMICIFNYYNITPIFIFDGKPPDAKKALIYKRNDMKNDAETKQHIAEIEYKVLFDKHNKTDEDYNRLDAIKITINNLKKQCVRVSWDDSEKARCLLSLCNIEYYNAEGEADELCAHMVISKKAWACMSDDMDMFLYGCTRVIRCFNLNTHTIVFYNINGILRDLDLHMHEFRKISVLSGTDYNIGQSIDITDVFKYFNIYKKNSSNIGFYEWYSNLKKFEIDNDKLSSIYDMFCNKIVPIPPRHISTRTKFATVSEFLRPYGFAFA